MFKKFPGKFLVMTTTCIIKADEILKNNNNIFQNSFTIPTQNHQKCLFVLQQLLTNKLSAIKLTNALHLLNG